MRARMDRIGIDFGTSNTAAACPGNSRTAHAQVLNVDPVADDARLLRSVLFFPQEGGETLIGAEAIGRYLEAEEGRFIQSAKSFLPSATFDRTLIRGRSWRIEDLVAAILRPLRERIEAQTKTPVKHLVLGRPAQFSADPALDAKAEARLSDAAERAGFPKPRFVIEPIAAALSYEESLDHDETVLVADFGAGTSDFTLMRLGPGRTDHADRHDDIIASGGVYIGGDRFDATIVEHSMLEHFGAGSTYMAFTARTELPAWITRKMLFWHELSLLRERDTLQFLERALETSDKPRALENLLSLVEENLAYHLYRVVEGAKRALSSQDSAPISFHMGDIAIDTEVRRADFEVWMQPLLKSLDDTVTDVLSRAGGQSTLR